MTENGILISEMIFCGSIIGALIFVAGIKLGMKIRLNKICDQACHMAPRPWETRELWHARLETELKQLEELRTDRD